MKKMEQTLGLRFLQNINRPVIQKNSLFWKNLFRDAAKIAIEPGVSNNKKSAAL